MVRDKAPVRASDGVPALSVRRRPSTVAAIALAIAAALRPPEAVGWRSRSAPAKVGAMVTLRALVVTAGLVITCGVGTATANFVGSATDPEGDAANPGFDLTDAGVAYDPHTGELSGAVRFATAPTQRALVTVFAGHRTATGCNGYPAVGFGSYTDELGASWLRLNDASGSGPRGEADKEGAEERTQSFDITDGGLKVNGGGPDCLLATVVEPGNSPTSTTSSARSPSAAFPACGCACATRPAGCGSGRRAP